MSRKIEKTGRRLIDEVDISSPYIEIVNIMKTLKIPSFLWSI